MTRLIFVALLAILSGGCVTGTRAIDMPIPSKESEVPNKGTVYIHQISDKRVFEQKPAQASTPSVRGKLEDTTPEQRSRLIGRQRNGYGKAMGDIALANDSIVQDEVKRLLTTGFSSRGYSIADTNSASLVVDVDIKKFWGWFRPGFAAVGFETDIECDLKIKSDVATSEVNVTGHALNKGQVASDANWRLSFQRAIEDFLTNFDTTMSQVGF